MILAWNVALPPRPLLAAATSAHYSPSRPRVPVLVVALVALGHSQWH